MKIPRPRVNCSKQSALVEDMKYSHMTIAQWSARIQILTEMKELPQVPGDFSSYLLCRSEERQIAMSGP